MTREFLFIYRSITWIVNVSVPFNNITIILIEDIKWISPSYHLMAGILPIDDDTRHGLHGIFGNWIHVLVRTIWIRRMGNKTAYISFWNNLIFLKSTSNRVIILDSHLWFWRTKTTTNKWCSKIASNEFYTGISLLFVFTPWYNYKSKSHTFLWKIKNSTESPSFSTK